MQEQVTEGEKTVADLKAVIADKSAQEKERSAEKEKHLASGYKKAKATEEALSKELVKVTSIWKNKEGACEAEEANVEAAKLANKEGREALVTKQNDIDTCAGEVEAAKLELEQRTQEHADAERDYQAMCAGVANEDADGESTMTLTDQLAEAKETMTVAVTRVKQAEMKIKAFEKVHALPQLGRD